MKRLLLGSLALSLLVGVACTDDSTSSASSSGSTPTSDGGPDAPVDASSPDTAPPADSGTDARSFVPATLLAFDPAKGQLPEGLALDGDRALVGFAPTGDIVAIDLTKQPLAATPFAKLPTPPPDNQGFMTGLAVDTQKRVYGALVSFAKTPAAGIYRAAATGGEATLFGSDPNMVFPNGLAFRPDGTLLVTDSAAGTVFAISPEGVTTPWVTSDLLKGKKDACGPGLNTFDIGANGLALSANAAYVANNDYGSIIRIPIDGSGAAGTPETLVSSNCAVLGGADGLALDGDGTLYVAVNRQDRIVRVSTTKELTVLGEGGVLDFPASLGVRGNELVLTSFALGRASSGGNPKPALVSLPLR